MSIFGDAIDFIFGGGNKNTEESGTSVSEQKGTINETGTSTTNTKQTQQTGSASETSQRSVATGESTSRLLSDEQIAQGTAILSRISASEIPDLSSLEARIRGNNDTALAGAQTIIQRALGADTALRSGTEDIIAGARKNALEARNKQYGEVTSRAGSQFSSAAQDIFARATDEAEIELAALAATMQRENRLQATQELMGAVQMLSGLSTSVGASELAIPTAAAGIMASNAGAASNILGALKGGIGTTTSRSVTDTTGRTETQQTINSAIQSVVNSDTTKNVDLNQNVVTVGNTEIDDPKGLLDLINALA